MARKTDNCNVNNEAENKNVKKRRIMCDTVGRAQNTNLNLT